jgi:hypothetical protein
MDDQTIATHVGARSGAAWPLGDQESGHAATAGNMALVSDHDATTEDPEIAEVLRRELLLLDPTVRASRERALELLHPDFVEFGASGRRWDAESIAVMMAQAAVDGERVEARGFSGVRLADDVVLLTFEARQSQRVSLRSSVWVRVDAEWRLRFHQGTVAAQ